MKYFMKTARACGNAVRETAVLIVCLQALVSFPDEGQGPSVRRSATQDCAILAGTWKMVRPPSVALNYSHEIVWEELYFATNGQVSIVVPNGDNQIQSKLTGTYELYNLADEGYAPRREIHITANSIHPPVTFVLYKVRTGEFSCFASGRSMLWAKDKNGRDCVFEAVECRRECKAQNSHNTANANVKELDTEREGNRDLYCGGLPLDSKDMYDQHLAIIQIMNKGDSSCVPALIPFTLPDKDSLLRQETWGQTPED